MVTAERLEDILRANGFLKSGSVYNPGAVESFADDTYESCINNVAHLLEYVLNNGTKDKVVTNTLRSAVKTSGDILKLKNTDASGGKFTSIKDAVKDQVSKCPKDISGMEISDYAFECAKSCMEGIDAFFKDVEGVDEEEYLKIERGYLKNIKFKPYEEWKKKANSILVDSKKTLKNLCDTLENIVDNSSTKAMEYCSAIIGSLSRWRDVTVHCYLIFLDTMSEDLDAALKTAEEWSARNVGVTKKTPKAESADLKGLGKWQNDQLFDYIVASKK